MDDALLMPPEPIGPRTSYGPRRVPEVKDTDCVGLAVIIRAETVQSEITVNAAVRTASQRPVETPERIVRRSVVQYAGRSAQSSIPASWETDGSDRSFPSPCKRRWMREHHRGDRSEKAQCDSPARQCVDDVHAAMRRCTALTTSWTLISSMHRSVFLHVRSYTHEH